MNPWDARYATGFVYGTAPNDFLAAEAARIGFGPVLCLAEGQGRNAVFLAERGLEVTGVDNSPVAVEGARRLAAERGVTASFLCADLADYVPVPGSYGAVVSVFCHLPSSLRQQVHQRACAALAPDGVLLLEAYTPRQLLHKTGGPPTADLLYDVDLLRADFAELRIERLEELERNVIEGALHHGKAAVVQLVAYRD